MDSGLSHAQLVYDDTLQRVCTARRERENLLNIRKGELKNAHRYEAGDTIFCTRLLTFITIPYHTTTTTTTTTTTCRLKMWMRDRQVTKAALATELRGDLTKEEEGLLRTQVG